MQSAALIGLFTIFSLAIVFHLLVIAKVIPYGIIWGGRLKTETEMYRFEAVSLAVNVILLIVVLLKADFLPFHLSENAFKVVFWVMSTLFLLNTVGNILSKNKLERAIFTPITILLTFFSIVLALGA